MAIALESLELASIKGQVSDLAGWEKWGSADVRTDTLYYVRTVENTAVQQSLGQFAETPSGTFVAHELNAGGLGIPQLLDRNGGFELMAARNPRSATAGQYAGIVFSLGRAGIAQVGAKRAIAGGSGVWRLNPFQRGQQIEQALGHNLPGNFPVIDRFENGLATSIKSLDLDAAAYQSASTLNRTLTGFVDKVAGFQGNRWAGVEILPQSITGRALDLAIPHGGSAAQQAIINQAVKYGASRGITVNVIPFP